MREATLADFVGRYCFDERGRGFWTSYSIRVSQVLIETGTEAGLVRLT